MNKQPLVLVTGASGLLGAAICKNLAGDFQVAGLDVSEPDDAVENVAYFTVDVTDDRSITDALQAVCDQFGEHIASVIHLAAYYDFSGAPSQLYEEVTVKCTERLLKHLQSARVEQFVFSSSMLVHRPLDPPAQISEDDPIEANWDYPQSKIEAEKTIQSARGNIPVVILRIAGVYSDDCNSVPLAQQIRRIAENRITSHVFPGNPSHGQAFVHIDDVVGAIRRIVERRHDLAAEETLLIGEPDTYSYDELQRTLGRLIHGEEDWTTQRIPKVVAKAGAAVRAHASTDGTFIQPWMIDRADDNYDLDVSRAKEKLGWEPLHRLIDTLPQMVAALRDAPAEWYSEHGLGTPP